METLKLEFAVGYEGVYNPSDCAGADQSASVFHRASDAVAAVKGKSWWNSDGRVKKVLVLVDQSGRCMKVGQLRFEEFK